MAVGEKLLVQVFLKGGAVLEFRCDKVTLKQDRLTGAPTELNFDGGVLPCPRFLDMSAVLAVSF